MPINYRLRELAKIQDNWYDGEGLAPNKKGLRKFGQFFKKNFDDALPLPVIFPTPDGGIQLEWKKNNSGIILEVNLSSFQGEVVIYKTNSIDDVKEINLDLSSLRGWTTLNKTLQQL